MIPIYQNKKGKLICLPLIKPKYLFFRNINLVGYVNFKSKKELIKLIKSL